MNKDQCELLGKIVNFIETETLDKPILVQAKELANDRITVTLQFQLINYERQQAKSN